MRCVRSQRFCTNQLVLEAPFANSKGDLSGYCVDTFSTSKRLERNKVTKLVLMLMPRLQVHVFQLSPVSRRALE